MDLWLLRKKLKQFLHQGNLQTTILLPTSPLLDLLPSKILIECDSYMNERQNLLCKHFCFEKLFTFPLWSFLLMHIDGTLQVVSSFFYSWDVVCRCINSSRECSTIHCCGNQPIVMLLNLALGHRVRLCYRSVGWSGYYIGHLQFPGWFKGLYINKSIKIHLEPKKINFPKPIFFHSQ